MLFTKPAAADMMPRCQDRDALLEAFAGTYLEAPAAIGRSSDDFLLVVLASPGGKTWTMIAVSPQKQACVLVAGEDWQVIERRPAGPKL